MNDPITAPVRLPRPPMTIAVSSDSDRLSVNPLGDVTVTQYANSDPARPAHAALIMYASTCVRATSMPDSRAATSLSRTIRNRLPGGAAHQVRQHEERDHARRQG